MLPFTKIGQNKAMQFFFTRLPRKIINLCTQNHVSYITYLFCFCICYSHHQINPVWLNFLSSQWQRRRGGGGGGSNVSPKLFQKYKFRLHFDNKTQIFFFLAKTFLQCSVARETLPHFIENAEQGMKKYLLRNLAWWASFSRLVHFYAFFFLGGGDLAVQTLWFWPHSRFPPNFHTRIFGCKSKYFFRL